MFEKHSLSVKIFDMMEHQCSCTNKFDKSFKHSFVIFRAWNEISSVDKLPQFRMNAAQTDWYKVASFTLNVLWVINSCNKNIAPQSFLSKSMSNFLYTSNIRGVDSLTTASLVNRVTGTMVIEFLILMIFWCFKTNFLMSFNCPTPRRLLSPRLASDASRESPPVPLPPLPVVPMSSSSGSEDLQLVPSSLPLLGLLSPVPCSPCSTKKPTYIL